MMKSALEVQLKEAIGYKKCAETCGGCHYFTYGDMKTTIGVCRLFINELEPMPVDQNGICKKYRATGQ